MPAGPTWALIERMVAAGRTRTWIARQLGYAGNGIQIGRERCTAANARRIEDLARVVLAREDAEREWQRERMRQWRERRRSAV